MTDRSAITAELKDEKNRRVEFFSGAPDVLSALDNIGYKVVASTCNEQTLQCIQCIVFRSYQALPTSLGLNNTAARISYGHFINNQDMM